MQAWMPNAGLIRELYDQADPRRLDIEDFPDRPALTVFLTRVCGWPVKHTAKVLGVTDRTVYRDQNAAPHARPVTLSRRERERMLLQYSHDPDVSPETLDVLREFLDSLPPDPDD